MNHLTLAQLRLLANAFESIASRSVVFTSENGTILYASQAAQDWLGYDADELWGLNAIDFHVPEELEAYARELSAAPSFADNT